MNLKFIICIILGGVLLLASQSVSAWDWDNVKTFNPGGRYGTITITNALGMGNDIARYTLDANTEKCDEDCYFELTIDLYSEDYIFSNVDFYNLAMTRNADVKEVNVLLGEVRPDNVTYYKNECKDEEKLTVNGTVTTHECLRVVDHTAIEPVQHWNSFDNVSYPAGTYRIRVEGKKKPLDKVEWVMSALGEEFTEWATWLPTDIGYGLMGYWKFDGNSSDTEYYLNLTIGSVVTNFTNGKIQQAYNLSGGNVIPLQSNVSSQLEYTQTGKNFSLAIWINTTQTIGQYNTLLKFDTNAFLYTGHDECTGTTYDDVCLYLSDGTNALECNANTSYINIKDGRWHYIVVTRNVASYAECFIDNVNVGSGTWGSGTWGSTYTFTVGYQSATNWYMGLLDEFGLWNRTLTATERTSLYNSGAGLAYPFGAVSNTITINANSPANNTNTTLNAVTFNCSASSTTAFIQNITLYFNNTLNSTYTGNASNLSFESTKYMPDGTYTWYCRADDDDGFNKNTTGFTLNVLWSLNITPNNPPDKYNSSISAVTFNCTAYSDHYLIDNMTLYLNGIKNRTTDTNALNVSFETTEYLPDNSYAWTCNATDTANHPINTSNRTLIVDATSPGINSSVFNSRVVSFLLPTNNVSVNWTASEQHPFNSWISYNGINYTAIGSYPYYGYNISLATEGTNSLIIYINDSFGNLNSTNISIYIAYIVIGLEEVSNSVFELGINTLTFFVNMTDILNTSAYLVWNNTNYAYTTRTLVENKSYRFVKTFAVPQNLSGLITYYWNYSVEATVNGTLGDNQTITGLSIVTNCKSDGVNVTVINVTLFNEPNWNYLYSNYSSTWLVWGLSKETNKTFNINHNSVSNFSVCMTPNTSLFYVDMYSVFLSAGYNQREYYLNNVTLNSSYGNTQLVYNYMPPSADSSYVDIYTYDLQDVPYPNSYVYVERYDASTGTYKLVGITKTDDVGHGVMPLELTDALYRFIVKTYPNVIQFTSEPRKITSTNLILRVTGTTFGSLLNTLNGISYDLTYTSATTTFRAEFTSDSGTVVTSCLNVFKWSISNQTRVCKSCETSASGVLLCTIDNSTGDYTATLSAAINPVTIIDSISITISTGAQILRDKLGVANSMVVAIILIGTMAMTAIWSPVVAILLGVVGIIFSIGLELITVSATAVVLLVMVAIFFITRVKQ